MNNDIVQLVSSYVRLRRRGKVYTGLCPFHSEKSPSFTVYDSNQSFYCFGCGAGGDIITFVRQIENLDYVDAVKFLAQRAGMEMPEYDDGASLLRSKVLEINRQIARYYFECLRKPAGKPGLDYLRQRGLTSDTIIHFGLGYAPNSWREARNYLIGKGFTEEEIIASGIAVKGRQGVYDQFRGRVMFPIIDLRGNVIGFGGRILGQDNGPKYLNSSDTPVFKKSRNLFAMNFAKAAKKKGFLLCEGYMDVISMHQAGFPSAVATLGTALTPEQARLLSQYTDTVTLAYDSDGPGQAATQRASGLLSDVGIKVRVLSIQDAKDPDEYIKKFGAERFALLINRASGLTEYEVAKLKDRFDLESADGKVGYMREFVRLMMQIRNPVEQDVYIAKAAAELEIQKSAIESEIKYQQKRTNSRQRKKEERNLPVFSNARPPAMERETRDYQRSKNLKAAAAEDKLLGILLRHPDYYNAIAGQITPNDFITDRNRIFAQELFSRLAEGKSIDLSLLGEAFSVEQMGDLSSLLASVGDMSFSQEDLQSYSQTLLECKKQKSKEDIAAMTDDDLKAYIASLASKKQKNQK
ncbi:MAG: DNA primase [Oscillospiraceae bacterium]|nr:DNA primase [Oscillospiraceae bacterium]MCI9363694.1 DNA primase [Oscillospiraceae bacterium]MCI9669159.1 DNA primase [Oscillospiraceae bacterium]